MLDDVRLAVRQILQRPGFAALTLLTLALGIGGNTAIFSVVEAALLRPLPYGDPGRLVAIKETRRGSGNSASTQASHPNFLDLRAVARTVRIEAYSGWGGAFTGSDGRVPLTMARASSGFFQLLDIRPARGRLLDGRDVEEKARVVVISEGFFRSRLAGDPAAIGHTILIDDEPWTVVGVLPSSFEFAQTGSPDVWGPLAPEGRLRDQRSLRWLGMLGRLAPNATVAQAGAELSQRMDELTQLYPQPLLGSGIAVEPLRDTLVGDVRPVLLLLLGAVAALLLIACVNVANLFLVRAAARRKELAVRAALGATRGRIVRQLLTEAAVLSLLGGALGVVLAGWTLSALVASVPDAQLATMPWIANARLDGAALAFTAAIALATGLLFGALPALQASRGDLREALGEEAHGSAGTGRRRLRQTLAAVEIALALVLVFGAGLVARSLARVLAVDPGFDGRDLLYAQSFLPKAYDDPRSLLAVERMLQAAGQVAGARATAAVDRAPLASASNTIRFRKPSEPVESEDNREAYVRVVTPNYFSVAGIHLDRGREFGSEDTEKAGQVMIVSRTLAARVFPGEDPVGKQVIFTYKAGLSPITIVGVVDDVKLAALDRPDTPVLYLPYAQSASQAVTVLVRGRARPEDVRRALLGAEPDLLVVRVETVSDLVARSPWLFARRWPALLVSAFAGLALLLALVGVYGVMAVSVAQRTREIGIRLALGAAAGDVARLVLRESGLVALAGIGAGACCALAVAQLLRQLLFGITPADPFTLASVAALLAIATLLAAWIPARRAMRVDPIEALRS